MSEVLWDFHPYNRKIILLNRQFDSSHQTWSESSSPSASQTGVYGTDIFQDLIWYLMEVLVFKIPCWIPPARNWDLQVLGAKFCSWKGSNLRKKSSVWAVLISNLINKTILHLWSYIVCTVWCLHTFVQNWLFPTCPSAQQHQKLQQFCLLHWTSATGTHVCLETQTESFIGSSP